MYNGTRVKINKVTREVLETPETTYNFEVEDYHTYYVSDSGVLVHNTCTQTLDPNTVRFSQSSVNDVRPIIDSMKTNGWIGDPIDVVRMPDGGLTSLDNSRLLAAKVIGTPVKAIVHNFDDALTNVTRANSLISRTGSVPSTWGQGVLNRIGNQNATFRTLYPYGSGITGWGGI